MAAVDSRKAVLTALFANIGVAIVKAIAAAVTGSGAMLAETIHSCADSGNQALLLLGARRAKRPPDERHPFGYGSERYFWAFIVALLLFTLGSLFSLYEGIHKLRHPEPLRQVAWAYVVLLVAIVLEGSAFRVARSAVRAMGGDQGFWRFFLTSKDPAVPLIYLEDLGALLGLAIALSGIAGSHLLGWIWADSVATLMVGALLGCIAAVLLFRIHKLLIGESASAEDCAAILEAAQKVPGVIEVRDLKTLHFGPETLIVALDVVMEGGAETVDRIEEAVQAAVPKAKHIAVEPA
ncbi:MAG: cation diffusion facilitator family transporter [Planctomycetota bacterium]